MRRLLQRIFFHMGFWPRAIARWMALLFSSDFLKIHRLEIDQAFYIEGSWIRLVWEVENAWLVRVNHPGGFYRGSDMTWFVAEPGHKVIEITVYGVRKRERRRFEVHVKPFVRTAAAAAQLETKLKTGRIHQGPVLTPKGRQVAEQALHFSALKMPLSFVPGQPGAAEQLVREVLELRSAEALEAFRQHHFSPPEASPETHE